MKNFYIRLFPVLLICLIGGLAYSNSFQGEFQLDDVGYITGNSAVVNVFSVESLWHMLNHPSRFIGLLSFAINAHFSGNNVFSYHLFNFIIHLLAATGVWWLVGLLFQTQALRKQGENSALLYKNRNTIACFTALLFVSHPVTTSAVSYITQRFASMATLFYLMSICFYLKGRLLSLGSKGGVVFFVMSGIFALIGMFTKQITFTLPFMIVMIEFYFIQDKKYIGLSVKKFLCSKYIFLFVAFVLLIPWIMDFDFKGIFLSEIKSGSHTGDLTTPLNYFYTQMTVIPHYLRLLLFPLGQNLDYDWPLSYSFFDYKVIFGFLLLSALFLFGLTQVKKRLLLSFGILWFFITASVESSVIPIRHVIFEHRMYLPMIGFCLAFVVMLFYLFRKVKVIICLLCVIVASSSFLTFQRNKVWKTEQSMWADVIQKSPNKARPYNNLAVAYLKKGNTTKALDLLNHALELDPRFFAALTGRGVLYVRSTKYDLALKDFNAALVINKGDSYTYFNRGHLYKYLKQYDQAIEDFNTILKISPNAKNVYFALGDIYFDLKEHNTSIEMYSKVIRLSPKYAQVYYNRAKVFQAIGSFNKAIDDVTQLLKFDLSVQEKKHVGNLKKDLIRLQLAK